LKVGAICLQHSHDNMTG